MEVIRVTDTAAIALAKTLMRTARFAALATIEPTTGTPLASRVGMASDIDATPLVLVSALAAHTSAITTDPRCSLLLGEPGKGDPLAYPRVTLVCTAKQLVRGSTDHERAARRYLNRNPKAKLYADLGDFSFFRLEVDRASLNGGFGKAYLLERNDLILENSINEELAANEQSALIHMNMHHRDAIAIYAGASPETSGLSWVLTGIDADGIDLAARDEVQRVLFPKPLATMQDLGPTLIAMAKPR